MINNEISKYLSLLNYSNGWLESGILIESELKKQVEEYKSGEDDNTEHYRYKTFKKFIDEQKNINNIQLTEILRLLKNDNDESMAASATIDLLKKVYLTNEQFEIVVAHSNSYGSWMIKYIDNARVLRSK